MHGRILAGGAAATDVGKRLGALFPGVEHPLHRGLEAGHVPAVIAVDPRGHRCDFLEMIGQNDGAFPGIRPDLDGLVLGTLLVGPHAKVCQPACLHGVAHGRHHD